MERNRAGDHIRLARDAWGIEPRSGTRPVRRLTAKHRVAQGRSNGRVPDAHFAKQENIRVALHRFGPLHQGRPAFVDAHRRCLRDVGSGLVEIERDNV